MCDPEGNLSKWDFHLYVAAGFGQVDGVNDKLNMRFEEAPLLLA
jgi:hypothetical protein